MARIVLALEQYHRNLARRSHPMVGVATCNVGIIAGGSASNVVPDSCTMTLDRRMIPGDDPHTVQRELEAIIASIDVAPATASIGDFLVSHWFNSTIDSPLAQTFLGCVKEVLGADPGPIGYLPGSDAKHLAGVMHGEMVVFGPGSYEVAHSADEYVDIAELVGTEQILRTFIDRTLLNDRAL
jgi:acetylornithine deacetylase/succinyl-diaminopimelate desuccinylase-like protein